MNVIIVRHALAYQGLVRTRSVKNTLTYGYPIPIKPPSRLVGGVGEREKRAKGVSLGFTGSNEVSLGVIWFH